MNPIKTIHKQALCNSCQNVWRVDPCWPLRYKVSSRPNYSNNVTSVLSHKLIQTVNHLITH